MPAAELRDYRGRISVLADCVIAAEAQATGRERQEIVREVLDAWAEQRLHALSLLNASLASEGLSGLASGISGQAPGRGSATRELGVAR